MRSEQELYRLLCQKPEKGLEALMQVYTPFVYTIVSGKLSAVCDRRDVEECVSDVFYEAFCARDSIDLARGSLKAFLAVLAKRRAVDMYRRRKKHSENLSAGELLQDIPAAQDVERTAVERETSEQLVSAIRALGEPDGSILIRKYYLGQPTKTIARDMGYKENTVDKRVSRALAKLKTTLEGSV